MSYLSIEFAFGFLIFFIFYWLFASDTRWQNILLLSASFALLASFSLGFAAHLAVYSCVIYALSVLIAYTDYQRFWLVVSVAVAVVNLFIFKYLDFFREYLQALFDFFDVNYLLPAMEIIMPIGIS
ncbi:MAG: membrane-bound O-acyltransferase family protein, partial [Gammaproteobacteria bacterium]